MLKSELTKATIQDIGNIARQLKHRRYTGFYHKTPISVLEVTRKYYRKIKPPRKNDPHCTTQSLLQRVANFLACCSCPESLPDKTQLYAWCCPQEEIFKNVAHVVRWARSSLRASYTQQ